MQNIFLGIQQPSSILTDMIYKGMLFLKIVIGCFIPLSLFFTSTLKDIIYFFKRVDQGATGAQRAYTVLPDGWT